MSSFFEDALSDPLISAGKIKMTVRKCFYIDGFPEREEKPKRVWGLKSKQPFSADEAKLNGFGDYATNQFIVIYSLQNIPLPKDDGEDIIVHFNNRDWYVRKVSPFVWDQDTPLEMGYYEVILSKYSDKELNPR